VRAAQKAGSRVLIVGMRMPPNYGARYTEDFAQTFTGLAKRYRCAFVPFLLEGVTTRREFMQDDNLHPNAAAQEKMLDNVWPKLLPLLAATRP
jgi:acyl-CoA thioesterase-1